ncbi:protein pleiotropic regulatory locus 1 [Phalaenopsis equestris]|uniref:protein pleiotropic regulatory locus 1 n=1 Tax=Phalaenopsis equestris TaxID=78828 RepID=UPI0009E1969B|nr:protein pleiotropic regulatory locus 1 [Phalaenopsis equestris]
MPGSLSASSAAAMEPVEPQSLKKLSLKSLKRALDLFSPIHGHCTPSDPASKQIRISYKLNAEYGSVKDLSSDKGQGQVGNDAKAQRDKTPISSALALPGKDDIRELPQGENAIVLGPTMPPKTLETGIPSRSITGAVVSISGSSDRHPSTSALMERIPSKWPRPAWHPPWKNYRVISGHLGWVRSIAFDPSNLWFCTGSADRTIKIWDVATGRLKLTLTGHIEQIRGLAVSQRHTYLFSAGDDKQVKCWDLEQNKVIRSYHGHLSGVYCLALHPSIDILLTGGRDSVCRVWDIRTKAMVCALSGHDNTVCSVFARPTDPQVVTGSHDTTIRFWDLVAGKTMLTLTHHKKSVRALALHPKEHTFVSGSADNIKKFSLPKGEFLHNMLSQQKSIVNAVAVNEDGILATAGDNGSLWFWDWKSSGHCFQQAQAIVQPGSLDSEACIYALSYDMSGTRLVTCEADKTIKMWKEDEMATPETHPLNFRPPKEFRRY